MLLVSACALQSHTGFQARNAAIEPGAGTRRRIQRMLVQTSVSRRGNRNSPGITPITTDGAPSTRMVCPSTAELAAKRLRLMVSLSTASEPVDGRSSPAANVLPISGRTLSVEKKPAVTNAPCTCSGTTPSLPRYPSASYEIARDLRMRGCSLSTSGNRGRTGCQTQSLAGSSAYRPRPRDRRLHKAEAARASPRPH